MGRWKEAKICCVCNREFTWRKKWERCWDTISTCSDRCKAERKRKKDESDEKTEKAVVNDRGSLKTGSMGSLEPVSFGKAKQNMESLRKTYLNLNMDESDEKTEKAVEG